ncbi:MAG: TonB family protein [Bdellovibrionota bacterium]
MSIRNFELDQKSTHREKNSTEPTQLNFSDLAYQLPHVEFIESSDTSSVPLHGELSYRRVSKKYFGLSFVIHTMMASALLFLSVPLITETPKEVITIEITDSTGVIAAPSPAPTRPVLAAPVEKETPAATKVSEKSIPKSAPIVKAAEIDTNEITEPVIKLTPIKPTEVEKAKPVAKPAPAIKTKASPKAAAETKTAAVAAPKAASPRPQVLAKESIVVVPETLDDIHSSDLDESTVKAATNVKPSAATLHKDVENDFNKLDEQPDALIEKESQQLGAITKNLEDENNENLKSMEEKNKAEQAAIEKANANRRRQDAVAIAAAKSAEDAEAKAAAVRAAAAEEAAVAKIAAAKAAAEADGNGKGTSQVAAGNPGEGEVRSLQDMRQMPGNPKPSYDYQERLRGDAGEVVFLAYVTRDGSTTQFKLSKSTGHRNLDLKTLAALKKWKFYPGQEGWVEFPFNWNLQGGATEMPTLLRRAK